MKRTIIVLLVITIVIVFLFIIFKETNVDKITDEIKVVDILLGPSGRKYTYTDQPQINQVVHFINNLKYKEKCIASQKNREKYRTFPGANYTIILSASDTHNIVFSYYTENQVAEISNYIYVFNRQIENDILKLIDDEYLIVPTED